MKIDSPSWLEEYQADLILEGVTFTPELAMRKTMDLLSLALECGSGGPFAASVWEIGGQCITMGVNLVVPSGFSLAHAEMMAISRAQEKLGIVDLRKHEKPLALVSSCEPCAMCYGGMLWSGVFELYYGSTKADAEAIGFVEGEKPEDWIGACQKQGVQVHPPILREEGLNLLMDYASKGGIIYNPKT